MTNARTNKPTTVPGIPKPPAEVSPTLRKYLENLSEAVEIRLGRRGDPRDRAITLRELIDSGLATELSSRPFNVNQGGDPGFGPDRDPTAPTAPTNFEANGGYSIVTIFWDYPNYGPHSHTEIWRHDQNIIGDAQLIGISSGISFVDPVGEGASYYYWARHVSLYDVYGPYNSASGTLAETALDVVALLGVLTGAITESQLYQDLGDRINLIDGDANLANSVAYRVAQETAARVAAINQEISDRTAAVNQEIADRTAAVNQEIADRTTAIGIEAAARAGAIATAVANLQSQIDDLNAIDAWSSAVSYVIDDLVQHNSKLWKAAAANSNSEPSGSNSDWTLVGDYTSLGDAVGANASAIQQINYVNVNSTSAAAQSIATLQSTINDPSTGLSATASALSSLNSAVNNGTTGLSATVTRVGALETTVNDPSTGVSATSAALDLVETTVNNTTTGVVATANRVNTLESAVNNPTTGLAATRATLLNDYYTEAETNTAISSESTQLSAAINLKNRTYLQGSQPDATGLIVGDIWFDSSDSNKAHRWNGSSWEETDDTRIAGTISNLATNYYTIAGANAAIAASALTLETQIDTKNKTFRQASAPAAAGLTTGDLWFDSNDNNKAYRWNGTSWDETDDKRIESTAANLSNNYYTSAETDIAIASATLELVTQTGLDTSLESYATNANLTSNYYTSAETESAISAQTLDLVSNTALNTELANYATNATLTSNYYTSAETESAISAQTSNLVSTTALNTELANYATNANLITNYYTSTETESAISFATQNLVSSTTLNNYVTTSTLTTNYYTSTETENAISAKTTTLSSQIGVKNRTYRQSSAPSTGLVTGDVWFDSDDSNKAYRWSGSAWVATDDTRIAGTIANLNLNYYTQTQTNAAIAASELALQSQINAKNRSFYQASAPSSSGLVEGDIWFDSLNNNKSYRWNGSAWVAIDDARIASTAANLTNNYYTKTETDEAISTETQSLVSTTALNTTLGSYVTNSTLTNNYLTSTQTTSAISNATQGLVSSTTLNNYVTNSTLTNNYYTKTATESAISTASNTLTSSFNDTLTGYATNVAVQQNYYTKASGETLEGRYTVKIDANGYVAGYGLAVTANNGTPTSEFLIRADRFAIGSPGQTNVVPFTVQATATTINGVSVPAGVYINDAYIRNGTITNAKIGNGQIDDAKIGSLSADKIVAGTIDTARLAIDNVTLDSVYDPSIQRNRLRIRDLGVDTAQIGNAAITSAKIGDAEVGTLKIAGNAITQPETYTAPDKYVTDAIYVSPAGSFVQVGQGNGDYIFDQEFGYFQYVGSGYGTHTYTTVETISGGHVAIETPQINVGVDSTAALQAVFYAFCDGSLVNDGGQVVYMQVDKYTNGSWTGYQTVAKSRVGARTGGGNTQSVFSIAMAHTATNLQNIKIRVLVGSQAVQVSYSAASNPTYLRNISVAVLGAKR